MIKHQYFYHIPTFNLQPSTYHRIVSILDHQMISIILRPNFTVVEDIAHIVLYITASPIGHNKIRNKKEKREKRKEEEKLRNKVKA